MSTNALFGLVLAGGESRRMGQDKALLRHDGQSQLAYLAGMLKSLTDEVFVSTRAEQSEEPERSRWPQIVDRYSGIGPVAGILSAMESHPQSDWLVVACDLPNIDPVTLRHLIDNSSETQPFSAYRSSHDDLPEPLCAIYRAGSDAILRQFIDDGVVCPRKILIRSDTCLLEQLRPESLDNINTPDDLSSSVLEASR
ncbi:MAG: molybdenum cofactor guanylyltransferase [Gammaproteobacteria bacterium]|nr:molybdenum cofactor guanylyltransferase [Gammaproteobacteria bacterium]